MHLSLICQYLKEEEAITRDKLKQVVLKDSVISAVNEFGLRKMKRLLVKSGSISIIWILLGKFFMK